MCPAVLVGALAVLLLPASIIASWELEALASVGRFHNEPTDPHSASSQIGVCACANPVNIENTSAGKIVRCNTVLRTKNNNALMASPFLLDCVLVVFLRARHPRRDAH